MHDALAHAPWERIMAMRALRSYGGGRPGLSRTISLISRVRPDRSLLSCLVLFRTGPGALHHVVSAWLRPPHIRLSAAPTVQILALSCGVT